MDSKTERLYRRFRESHPVMLVGHNARLALNLARTVLRWKELEDAGLVKLEAKPDEDYDWLGEEPEMVEKYGSDGAWGTVGSYRLDESDPWIEEDSVWGSIGYRNVLDPHENPYIGEIMSATIAALDSATFGQIPQL